MDRPLVDQPDGEYMQLEAGLEPQHKKNRWNPLNWGMRDKIIAAVVVVLVLILIIVLACTLKGHSSSSSSSHSCAGVQTYAKDGFSFSPTYTGYHSTAYSAACKLFPPSSNDQKPSCSDTGSFSTSLKCVACNTDGERSVSNKKFYNRSTPVKNTVDKYVNKGIDCRSSNCACSGITQSDCVAASANPTSETYCNFKIETKKNSTGSEFECFGNRCGALTAYECPLAPNPDNLNPPPPGTNRHTGSKLHCDDKGETFSLEQQYYCGAKWIAPKLVSPVPDAMLQILKPVKKVVSGVAKTSPPTGYWTYTTHTGSVFPYCADLISSLV